MPVVDDPKQYFLSALMMAMKAGGLANKLDVNQTVFLVSNRWSFLLHGNQVDLEPLHELLMNQSGVTTEDIALVCLMMQRREEKMGLTLKLPAAVATLPPATKEELLQRVKAQAMATAPPATVPRRDLSGDGAKAREQGKPEGAVGPRAVEPRSTVSTAEGQRKPRRVRTLTFGLAGMFLLAVGVHFFLAPRAPESVAIQPPSAVPHLVVVKNNSTFLAFDPDKDWSFTAEELSNIALEILAKVEPLGGKNVLLCGNADRSCRNAKGVAQEGRFTAFQL